MACAVSEKNADKAPGPRSDAEITTGTRIAAAVVVGALLAAPALICLQMALVKDADVWWHLRTAEWMLQHHSVPRTDPFTRFGAGQPWAAYSWLFELLVFGLFQRLGLVGLVLYSTGMVVAITAAVYHLYRRLQADFTVAAVLTLTVILSLTRLFTPRPWLFSILFFVLELDILMHVRKTGRKRELLWLPLLFAVWANVHIQFIDGLVILGIALADAMVAGWRSSFGTRMDVRWPGGILLACVLAACANPYGVTIYKIAYDLASQNGVLFQVAEMLAPSFRALGDYSMLFLAMAAVAALAWRRKAQVFDWGLLLFAATVSFRSRRDMWVLAIVAAAILAAELRTGRERQRNAWFALPITALVTLAVLTVAFFAMHINNARLSSQVVEGLPVHAVEVVKQRGYPGPLFNNYDWGGYLIWALRMPVAVDGRAAFNGDNRLGRTFSTWNGGPGWSTDPDLESSRLVIGPVDAPLTQLLRMDKRFHLVFEDKVAAVFVSGSN